VDMSHIGYPSCLAPSRIWPLRASRRSWRCWSFRIPWCSPRRGIRCLFSKRKETKLNKLKVLFPPIFLEMKSHRAHDYDMLLPSICIPIF
jgi:hypothetical protein